MGIITFLALVLISSTFFVVFRAYIYFIPEEVKNDDLFGYPNGE